MQAEALDAIQEANHHVVLALAGAFVQYSLTSHDFRPRYSSLVLGRLRTRVAAIRHLDQNCAFALHATNRWKGVSHTDDAMAKLMLWGDRVNSAAYHLQDKGNERIIALIMARRRLGKITSNLVTRNCEASETKRIRNCETAAYWLEVAQNLMPPSNYARALYDLDDPPNLSHTTLPPDCGGDHCHSIKQHLPRP